MRFPLRQLLCFFVINIISLITTQNSLAVGGSTSFNIDSGRNPWVTYHPQNPVNTPFFNQGNLNDAWNQYNWQRNWPGQNSQLAKLPTLRQQASISELLSPEELSLLFSNSWEQGNPSTLSTKVLVSDDFYYKPAPLTPIDLGEKRSQDSSYSQPEQPTQRPMGYPSSLGFEPQSTSLGIQGYNPLPARPIQHRETYGYKPYSSFNNYNHDTNDSFYNHNDDSYHSEPSRAISFQSNPSNTMTSFSDKPLCYQQPDPYYDNKPSSSYYEPSMGDPYKSLSENKETGWMSILNCYEKKFATLAIEHARARDDENSDIEKIKENHSDIRHQQIKKDYEETQLNLKELRLQERMAKLEEIPKIDIKEEDLPYEFESPFYHGGARKLISLYSTLYRIKPSEKYQKRAKKMGLFAIQLGDISYANKKQDAGDAYKDLAYELLDIALGLNPITGMAQSLYEVIYGRSLCTGKHISTFDRSFAFLNIVTLGTGKYFKTFQDSLSFAEKTIGKLAHLRSDYQTAEVAIKEAISEGTRIINSAKHIPGGAKNMCHYYSLKKTLKEAELSSIFDKSGIIKSEHVRESIKIISGKNLGNPKVIAELTKDGSNIINWDKYTYNIKTSSGTYQIHYYFNEKLGKVNPHVDYKIKIPRGN